VHFIDNRTGKGAFKGNIVLPIIVMLIDDNAFHRSSGVLTHSAGCAPTVVVRDGNRFSIGIEKYFARIKTMSLMGGKGPVGTVSVQLARFQVGNENMPVVVGFVSLRIKCDDLGRLGICRIIKKKQLH
jgi:hypothetical protein